jgi:dihydroorotate dehydrogenase (NAD+) catalytic subunit
LKTYQKELCEKGKKIMADLSTTIAGVTFKNPVIPASGAYGFGREYECLYPLSRLGGISCKGTTLNGQNGNLPPRIAETPSGMLNSVGLQNPGIDHFIEEELPYLKTQDTVIIANVAGHTVEDCMEIARRLEGTAVDMIELNISCPNVKQGGAAFGTSCTAAEGITAAVRKCTTKPLMVKLSPNVTSITDIAKAVEAAGADAVSLINTLLGMRIDINTRRPILKNNVGGLSGPAVFPVAVRMVWQVANAVKIPVVGMGGIATWKDAVEMMLAGASAVQIGAAIFSDPWTPIKVIDGMNQYLDENGIEKVTDLIGGVQPW